jgi:predicted nucleotidyltransferase component of viral defense system
MLKEFLRKIVLEKRAAGVPDFVIRNFMKEYLQYPVLEFIYGNPRYKNFIFTGGSCLRICFEAPRLSEDLDFDLPEKDFQKFNPAKLAQKARDYFENKYLLKIETRRQGKQRIYLKFPILKELGIAEGNESDWLFVKIETSPSPFRNFKTEIMALSKYGFNFVARNYSLPYLMTGKLNAIFSREWFKGKENEIDIKGRDFYDLFWYFQKGVLPDWKNLKRLTGISGEARLKKELKKRIKEKVTPQKISYDLKNFFLDQNFVSDFCKNYGKIMEKYF